MASEKISKSKKMVFTVKALKALKPDVLPQQFTDLAYPGLVAKIQPLGKKEKTKPTITFFFSYRSPHTTKRVFYKLGRFVEIRQEWEPKTDEIATLEEARQKTKVLAEEVRKGVDPKNNPQSGYTLKKVVEDFLAAKKGNIALQTYSTYKSALTSKAVPALGKKHVARIDCDDVSDLLRHVRDNSGEEMMVQTKKALSSLYTYALANKKKYGVKINIVKQVDMAELKMSGKAKSGKKKDKVWLYSEEIKIFWNFLEEHASVLNDSYARLWKLILITGSRPIEVTGMRWSDIGTHTLRDIRDLDKIDMKRLWLRPEWLMKSSNPHLTYLTDLALEVIEPLRGMPGDFVLWDADELEEQQLISRRKYGGQLLKMTHGIFNKHEQKDRRRIPQLAEIRKFTQHDLRRTTSTQMGNIGVTEDRISKILAHAVRKVDESPVTRKHYNLAEYIHEKIDALTSWEERLREFLDLPPTMNRPTPL